MEGKGRFTLTVNISVTEDEGSVDIIEKFHFDVIIINQRVPQAIPISIWKFRDSRSHGIVFFIPGSSGVRKLFERVALRRLVYMDLEYHLFLGKS